MTRFHLSTAKYLRVITDRTEQIRIIRATHEGLGETVESRSLGGHLGWDKTEGRISTSVWWPGVRKDVRNYIQHCDRCQRRGPRLDKGQQLHPVKIPPKPWSQIGVDTCSMPKSKDGLTCMVVAVDYFSKWMEAEPLVAKTAEGVANFLYQCMCRHGCADIQINDRGREFVNSVSTALHKLSGVEQRVTSAYHPQANGLVERENRTIQGMMVKMLTEVSCVEDWPRALPGTLFALRTSKHATTKYSPFFLLYGREPKLPIDVESDSKKENETESSENLKTNTNVSSTLSRTVEVGDELNQNGGTKSSGRSTCTTSSTPLYTTSFNDELKQNEKPDFYGRNTTNTGPGSTTCFEAVGCEDELNRNGRVNPSILKLEDKVESSASDILDFEDRLKQTAATNSYTCISNENTCSDSVYFHPTKTANPEDFNPFTPSFDDIKRRIHIMEDIRKGTTDNVMKNIHKAQERQSKQYNKRKAGQTFEVGDSVLLYNLRRADRKGGGGGNH